MICSATMILGNSVLAHRVGPQKNSRNMRHDPMQGLIIQLTRSRHLHHEDPQATSMAWGSIGLYKLGATVDDTNPA